MSANATAIHQAAADLGLGVYFMAKQYGRNPDASRAVIAAGIESAVCVDLQDLEAHELHGIRIGHVGHLVQPYRGSEAEVVAARPEVVTVFSLECAQRLSAAAKHARQPIGVLLRVCAPGDRFYFGQGGGLPLEEIEEAARAVQNLPALTVCGVTTFPCLLADDTARTVGTTHNFDTLIEAADRLRAAGFRVTQVNAPGTTSVRTLQLLAEAGATHVEPGNALHGTTPTHLFEPDAPELPAIVYVSEVSHLSNGDAFVFAEGHYIDKVLGRYPLSALCGRDHNILGRRFHVDVADDGAIHYYTILRGAESAGVCVGDTVVFCFRPQVFVTRGRTQAVGGLHSGRTPQLGPRYDAEARVVKGKS
jgi:predicted amino acid racemase